MEGGGQAVPENCKIWGSIADLSLSVGTRRKTVMRAGFVPVATPLASASGRVGPRSDRIRLRTNFTADRTSVPRKRQFWATEKLRGYGKPRPSSGDVRTLISDSLGRQFAGGASSVRLSLAVVRHCRPDGLAIP